MVVGADAVAALQHALEVEHAAIFGYGVVGAHLDDDAAELASECHAAHLLLRDEIAALVAAGGATPAAAAPAYDLPVRVGSARAAVRLAVLIEEDVAHAHADAVAATTGDVRAFAIRALGATAVRAARWRGRSTPFPGLDGIPDGA